MAKSQAVMKLKPLADMKARKLAIAEAVPPKRTEAGASTAADRKTISLRLSPGTWRQLRKLAFDDERPMHDLLVEAVNDYLVKRGQAPR